MRFLAYEEKMILARTSFKDFIEFMMPDPNFDDDARKTKYVCKPVHQLMINLWEQVEQWEDEDSGGIQKGALSVPPQSGKTTHTSIMGTCWTWGKNPNLYIAIGTYNESRAKDIGGQLRALITSPRYREVFPEVVLAMGGKSKSFLQNDKGGTIRCVGRGSSITGNPVDLLIVDDPVKDKAEAQSTAALEESWLWYTVTLLQRLHRKTKVFILHTRWAGNDLIGRLCDPTHPDYNSEYGDEYSYINVSAYDNDPDIAKLMGIAPEDYIWPEKFSPELLSSIARRMPANDFSALYMGKPVPDDGDFFTRDMIKEYTHNMLPPREELKIYAASDHAVTTKSYSDYTVMVIAGVDSKGIIWIMDVVRKKMKSDESVAKMVELIKKYKPIQWFAASDQISKSIGPFLKAQLRDGRLWSTYIVESPEIGDKIQKSQSIRGAMSMGQVRFNSQASWFRELVLELMRFRGAGDAHDDQVDALGHLGRGLEKMMRGKKAPANDPEKSSYKTLDWVRGNTKLTAANESHKKALAGW